MFDRFSVQNAATVEDALECGCEPYKSVYTYERWRAQGFQVQRGQHGVHLPTMTETKVEDEDGNVKTRRRFTTAAVFCRHQVEPIREKGKAERKAQNSRAARRAREQQPTPAPAPAQEPARPTAPAPRPEPVAPLPPVNSQVDKLMSQWKEI
jgi:hypothetical protein